MYFVHPQIKFNFPNLARLFFCLLKAKNKKIEEELREMFPEKEVYFTDMGRGAFRLIIEALNLQNSQILMPSYICDIFYSILKSYNISPVFLDADKQTFNINTEEIARKITPQTKALMVCHTYGLPCELDKILVLAKKYNLKVIEDCAHCLGGKYQGKYLGNFGDAALFSLYKLFPTLRGGMAILENEKLKMKNEKCLLKTKFGFRDFVSLLNCFPFFSFLFKKYAGELAQKHIRKEKISQPALINRVSLNIFAWQLRSLEETIKKRKWLGALFQTELKKMGFETQSSQNHNFTFLSALSPQDLNRDEFVKQLRKKGIFATRIWHTPIILNKEAQKDYEIVLSQFPNTLEIAKRVVNLPLQNFYTRKDIGKIIKKTKTILSVLKNK